MAQSKIIGRKAEIRILEQAISSKKAEFIAVYGRRRIGKTFLIKEFFGDLICFELIGVHNASLAQQLGNFTVSLGKAMGLGIQPQKPGSWQDAFFQLEQLLESPAQKEKTGKKVIFMDELPWLNSVRSNFIQALEHFWNSYASQRTDLILVVCGSAASWMIQNIVQSKGGLHNRLTRQIRLMPFTLEETEEFLIKQRISLTRVQITELYMAMGGVPFYLMQAEPGFSTSQIIDSVCFSATGLLRSEFDKLFSSLFDESNRHRKIVETLAKKRTGITRNELLEITAIPSGGTASLTIEELEESGFIESGIPWGKKSNDLIFKLTDEFTLFYFTWLAELGKKDPGAGYWLSRQNSPRRRSWSGFAFENICIKHVVRLKAALGIAMVETTEGPWYYRPGKGSTVQGAQIDLLIDRRDSTINICEMKYSAAPFTIDAKYAGELRNKIDVFRSATGTRKNLFLTMITTYGLNENNYSRDLVTRSLTIDDLFQKLL
jgi:AAA+ ATPase superfamily predicted ATPase